MDSRLIAFIIITLFVVGIPLLAITLYFVNLFKKETARNWEKFMAEIENDKK